MYRYGLSTLLGTCIVSLLVGCGGGSDDNDTSVPTEPNVVSLSIQGNLVDGLKENANIEVFVGDVLVFTDSSSDGGYLAKIELDDSESESLVKVVATSQDNDKIKFASTLGPFSSLLEYAGDDGVLDASENHSVNISSVSTAISAILESETDSTIESFEAWEAALIQVEAQRAFSVATAIKIFLDYPDTEISFPEGVENTYQFASDFNLSSEYVNIFATQMEELFNEVQFEMVQTPGLISVSTSGFNEIEGTYYLLSEGGKITLNQGGTGKLLTSSDLVNLTWSQEDGGVSIELNEPVAESFTMLVDGEYLFVNRERRFNRLFWMFDDKHQGKLIVEVEDTIKYPDYSGLAETSEISFIATNSVRSSGLLDPRDVLVIGGSYSMPISYRKGEVKNPVEDFYPEFEYSSLKMSFNGDFFDGGTVNVSFPAVSGEGELIESDLSATWSIDDSYRLIVNLSDDEQLIYSLLTLNANGIFDAFVEEKSPDGSSSFVRSTILFKDTVAWVEEDVAGIYVYQKDFFSPFYEYFFDISADGTVSTVYVDDLDGNASIDGSEYIETAGLWQLKNDGRLSIRVYRSNDGYCIPDSWDPENDANCVLFQERDWDLYQIDGSNKYWFRYNLNRFSDLYLDVPNRDSIDGHILNFSRLYNQSLYRVSERPVSAPEE